MRLENQPFLKRGQAQTSKCETPPSRPQGGPGGHMGPCHPSPGLENWVETENPDREEEGLYSASGSGFRISSK